MSSKKRKGDGKRDGEKKHQAFTTPIATNMIYTKKKRTKQQKAPTKITKTKKQDKKREWMRIAEQKKTYIIQRSS